MKFLLFLILLGSLAVQAKEFQCDNEIKINLDFTTNTGDLDFEDYHFSVKFKEEVAPGCCPGLRCTPCTKQYLMEAQELDYGFFTLNQAVLKENWPEKNHALTGSYDVPASTRVGYKTKYFKATCQIVNE